MDIIFIGNYRNQNQGFRGSVYGTGGVSPVIRAADYKEPVMILEVIDEQRRSNRDDKEVWEQERMLCSI